MKKILFLAIAILTINFATAQQRASIHFHVEGKTYQENALVSVDGAIYKALQTTASNPVGSIDWQEVGSDVEVPQTPSAQNGINYNPFENEYVLGGSINRQTIIETGSNQILIGNTESAEGSTFLSSGLEISDNGDLINLKAGQSSSSLFFVNGRVELGNSTGSFSLPADNSSNTGTKVSGRNITLNSETGLYQFRTDNFTSGRLDLDFTNLEGGVTRNVKFQDASGTIALLSDVTSASTPSLQDVLDEDNSSSTPVIISGANGFSELGDGYLNVSGSNQRLIAFNPYNGSISLRNSGLSTGIIRANLQTSTRFWDFPDKSGTIAMLDDIPTGGGSNPQGYYDLGSLDNGDLRVIIGEDGINSFQTQVDLNSVNGEAKIFGQSIDLSAETVRAVNTSISNIDATGDKALVTKEYADLNYKSSEFEVLFFTENDTIPADPIFGFPERIEPKRSIFTNVFEDDAPKVEIGNRSVDLTYRETSSPQTGVSGSNSFGFGQGNLVSGNNSVIIGGTRNTATNGGSIVIGSQNSNSTGQNSTVIGGTSNAASGSRSVVFGGESNISSGVGSATMGVNNRARSFSEFAVGAYTTDYTPTNTNSSSPEDRVFNVGNGVGPSNRSDAFTIYKNGAVQIHPTTQASIASPELGMLIVDSADGNQLKFYNGTAWVTITTN